MVGDAWRGGAETAAAQAVTAILAHGAGINAWWLTPIAVLAALAWSLRRAVRAQRRSGG